MTFTLGIAQEEIIINHLLQTKHLLNKFIKLFTDNFYYNLNIKQKIKTEIFNLVTNQTEDYKELYTSFSKSDETNYNVSSEMLSHFLQVNLNSSNNEFNKLALLRYSIKIDIDIGIFKKQIKKQATQL